MKKLSFVLALAAMLAVLVLPARAASAEYPPAVPAGIADPWIDCAGRTAGGVATGSGEGSGTHVPYIDVTLAFYLDGTWLGYTALSIPPGEGFSAHRSSGFDEVFIQAADPYYKGAIAEVWLECEAAKPAPDPKKVEPVVDAKKKPALAHTGSEVSLPLAVGVSLISAGGVALMASRRRRQD